jgi:hypothetical protein
VPPGVNLVQETDDDPLTHLQWTLSAAGSLSEKSPFTELQLHAARPKTVADNRARRCKILSFMGVGGGGGGEEGGRRRENPQQPIQYDTTNAHYFHRATRARANFTVKARRASSFPDIR